MSVVSVKLEMLEELRSVENALHDAETTTPDLEAKARLANLLHVVQGEIAELAAEVQALLARSEELRIASRNMKENSESLRADSLCLREESQMEREKSAKNGERARRLSNGDPRQE